MVPKAPLSTAQQVRSGGRRGHSDDRRRRIRYRPDELAFKDDWHSESYWYQTRRPLPNLVFILPMLGMYEAWLAHVAGPAREAFRTGMDSWVSQGLATLGFSIPYLLPSSLVGVLLYWLFVSGVDGWKLRVSWLLGMGVESLALSSGLIGLSRLLDMGLIWLDNNPVPLGVAHGGDTLAASMVPLIRYFGAGLYEEAVFRLMLLPVLYVFFRIVQTPELLAGTLAITGSALTFAIAHHVGLAGEPFTWYVFLFRWLAGIAFAWIFLVRGFGIAVGTHIAYDVLVGYGAWAG